MSARKTTVRALAPRLVDALSVRPVVVSDLSAPASVGLEARAFRALVRELGIPHRVVGKRMLVLSVDLEAALRGGAAAEPASEPDVDSGPSREAMLAAVGAR